MYCRTVPLALVALTLLTGCNEGPAMPEPSTNVKESGTLNESDTWIGRWTGPEGTYVDVAKAGNGYLLTIQSLDGQQRFEAQWRGDRMEFLRDGPVTVLRATDGKETGMKWLQDKRHCLTVRPGEGFCRD